MRKIAVSEMISVVKYTKDKFDTWNNFVEKANNGTIFHRLDFLGYHGNKFEKNEHHLMFYKGDTLLAVLPLAIFEEGEVKTAKSPYGASWGGLVFSDKLSIKYVIFITDSLLEYLGGQNVSECVITVTPQCYYIKPTNYFEFSLFSKGFQVVNRENHLVVELPDKAEKIMDVLDSKCRNQTRKGLKVFTKFLEETSCENYYPILMEDKVRHNSMPTHTEKDLEYLSTVFPKAVTFDVVISEEDNRAGICYFKANRNCVLTFYMSQQNSALRLNGTNALVYRGMERAVLNGVKYFDFGGSSLNSKIRNIGVSEFKESFGAYGVFRDTYKINLKS